jgi:hypothetical protein
MSVPSTTQDARRSTFAASKAAKRGTRSTKIRWTCDLEIAKISPSAACQIRCEVPSVEAGRGGEEVLHLEAMSEC